MNSKLTTMNVSLPKTMRRYVESRIVKGGFANASEYVRHLIRAEAASDRGERERLEKLLIEGLESGPATPMTRKDWDELKQTVRDQASQRRRKSA